MSDLPTVEQRLARLETEVAHIRKLLAQAGLEGNWLERVAGSMKDYPEFEEVVRLGREYRESLRPPESRDEAG